MSNWLSKSINILGSQKYLGCYTDNKNRDLVGVLENLGKKNTLEKCLALCLKKSKLLDKLLFNRYFIIGDLLSTELMKWSELTSFKNKL